jgi:hypothetical protein
VGRWRGGGVREDDYQEKRSDGRKKIISRRGGIRERRIFERERGGRGIRKDGSRKDGG